MSRTVLITGALAGIGRATAFAFARDGWQLVVSGRNDDAGQALQRELRDAGAEAVFRRADVRHEDEVRALVDAAVARFGRINAAVNNAGTEGTPGPVTEQDADSVARTFDTNVLGTVLSLKHEIRAMREAGGGGSIVNISSTYGHRGAAGASIYVASKHAVEGLTKSVALEVAALGIRVNAVAPGPTETGMLDRFTGTAEIKRALAATVPLGRVARADEPAAAIVFVASEAASFITGQVLGVDGGKAAG
ncbi:MAG: glucose 1-dehydrogenase [Gluconacetobacter diazotrophicus]|nr:glucose 1-dehydrogenase [Gluconacetobacter diazotrophicus]